MDSNATLAKGSATQTETMSYTGAEKTTWVTKVKRHCRRFWWLDFLVVASVALAINLPLVYVGGQQKAQGELNKATLEVAYQGVSHPTPDSFHLSLNTEVVSHSSHHPDLESFNASLFLEATEPNITSFADITIPEVHVEAEFPVSVDQDVFITNMDQFIAYNKLVFNSDEFRLALRGETAVKLSGLPKYNVDYNKVVTMKGLNKLAGFNITYAHIKIPPEPDGATLIGTVSIPNPSVISLEMGNVTMDLSTNGTYLGYSLIQDLVLKPGNNSFDMRSYVNTTKAIGFVGDDFILHLDIVGNSCINSAGEHIPYFEAAIRGNTMHYNLNVTEALYG